VEILEKSFEYEDVEQLLAEVDEFLSQIDSEFMDYLEEGQRAEIEEQTQNLRKLTSEVQNKIGNEGPGSVSHSEGMHEAMTDIAKAMKSLASFLSP
jgi:hypothetical protein